MATGKRYYWMKLKETFMTSDTVDYFMSQPNGAQYVVLYQMLCIKTINTGGRLQRQIGELVIPYDISKIQRDTKWFSEDTIRVALQLFKSAGLIYEDENGVLVMTDHKNLVGSETDWTEQKRNQNEKKLLGSGKTDGNIVENGVENFHTDIRDKRLDIRDKDIESITDSKESVRQTQSVRRVQEAWNALGLSQVSKISSGSNRGKCLKARINEYGIEKVLEAIERIRKSSFLRGQSKSGWTISFDWFVKPNNFPKVLEGNYDDKSQTGNQNQTRKSFLEIMGVDDE